MSLKVFLLPRAIVVVLVAVLVFPEISITAQNESYASYSSGSNFNGSHLDSLVLLGSASISGGALQLTPDSMNDYYCPDVKSGRAMLRKPFKLWEERILNLSDLGNNSASSDDALLASFNSTFLINVFPASQSKIPAEGLTFLIAPNLEFPWGSNRGWLGLTTPDSDGDSHNNIVAIEFDTFKQDYDPDNNHIGLNVNGVRSIKAVSLYDYDIIIAPDPANPVNYTVWVHYNGKSQFLEVFMVKEGKPKPIHPVLNATINLKHYLRKDCYIGFSGSSGIINTQLNSVLKWDLMVEILPEPQVLRPDQKNEWLTIGPAVVLPGLVFLVITLWFLCYYRRRAKDVEEQNILLLGVLKRLPGTPREFRFKDLKKATNNFNEKMKLGQGGFGVVYKGVLVDDENTEVAVKKFSRESIKGIADFLAELTIINRLRHKHLVRLIGWCHKKRMLLLVYEYMPNGSLDNHLFGGPEKILSWDKRYKIIYGVASALHYLHNEYDQKVVHRDLKASNIMLDSDFNARLGDFGLARAIENERTSYAELEGVPGTVGYIAPECLHTGKATRQSDVFGFGAVILEVVCGQRPWTRINGFTFLVDWVWKLYREGRILEAVDDRLGDDYLHEQAERLLLLGLACSHPIASERPRTQTIVQIISGSTPTPIVPHFKPAFVWPTALDTLEEEEENNSTRTAEILSQGR